jgi:DHA1 family bicyclomycin/chloramphenicol resistance-like MFS transporter
VLLSGLALFLIGSVLSMLAQSLVTLALGRLVQAIGAGCGATLVRAIARDSYGQDRLVKAIAYLTMFYTLGPMVAPIAGGALVDAFGWRSAFAFSIFGGLIISTGAFFIIKETRPADAGGSASALSNFLTLFKSARFTAFVMQTGFNTGSFMVTAAASSYLMKEMLGRSATEFGFWFLAFPFGFFAGNFLSSRVGNRASIETMTLLGAGMSLAAIVVQATLLLMGHLTPMSIFVPGFFLTLAQGVSLPYTQTGAMSVNPRLAGTASGISVCMQNLLGAAFTQIYGLLADGTVGPLIVTASISGVLGVIAGGVPFLLRARGNQSAR